MASTKSSSKLPLVYTTLQNLTVDLRDEHPDLPIATLQMLWGKIYAVWDPDLAHAALRSRAPAFEPLMPMYAKSMLGASDETVDKIKRKESELLPAFFEALQLSMTSTKVAKMNVFARRVASETFDGIDTLEGDNLYLWVRDLITQATTRSLYGDSDPFLADPGQAQHLWYTNPLLSQYLAAANNT